MRNTTIDIEEIKCLAIDSGWEITMERLNVRMTRFERGNVAFDLWLSGTVGMFIRKEKKNSYSLKQKEYLYNQTQKDIEKILNN